MSKKYDELSAEEQMRRMNEDYTYEAPASEEASDEGTDIMSIIKQNMFENDNESESEQNADEINTEYDESDDESDDDSYTVYAHYNDAIKTITIIDGENRARSVDLRVINQDTNTACNADNILPDIISGCAPSAIFRRVELDDLSRNVSEYNKKRFMFIESITGEYVFAYNVSDVFEAEIFKALADALKMGKYHELSAILCKGYVGYNFELSDMSILDLYESDMNSTMMAVFSNAFLEDERTITSDDEVHNPIEFMGPSDDDYYYIEDEDELSDANNYEPQTTIELPVDDGEDDDDDEDNEDNDDSEIEIPGSESEEIPETDDKKFIVERRV